MARPFMFAALCQRAQPLKHSLAESIFVSRVTKTAKKIFVSRKIRQQGHSLAEVSLYRKVTKRKMICIASYKSSYNFLREANGLRIFFIFISITQSVFRFQFRHMKNICLQYHCQDHDKPMEQKFHFSVEHISEFPSAL